MLGGIGLLLPAMTRVAPALTPLAAAGLTLTMILAAVFHIVRGELALVPANLLLGAPTAVVAAGRWRSRPVAPREPDQAAPARRDRGTRRGGPADVPAHLVHHDRHPVLTPAGYGGPVTEVRVRVPGAGAGRGSGGQVVRPSAAAVTARARSGRVSTSTASTT
ncbi:DoxX family protein [Nonomuraea salmonea]|uniref:DoxX family protein n=1 Tax=Nonomuraea salmonea TaxID=46181 RepID=UPI0031E56F71